jgi:histidine triad (HIT) family protein
MSRGGSAALHVKIFPVFACVFCDIVAGQMPATIVSESRNAIAIQDINPQAPVHILVMPRRHLADVTELSADRDLLFEVMGVAMEVAQDPPGVAAEGFRVVFNTGPSGGQTVGHVHAHVLSGRQMTWPPG